MLHRFLVSVSGYCEWQQRATKSSWTPSILQPVFRTPNIETPIAMQNIVVNMMRRDWCAHLASFALKLSAREIISHDIAKRWSGLTMCPFFAQRGLSPCLFETDLMRMTMFHTKLGLGRGVTTLELFKDRSSQDDVDIPLLFLFSHEHICAYRHGNCLKDRICMMRFPFT